MYLKTNKERLKISDEEILEIDQSYQKLSKTYYDKLYKYLILASVIVAIVSLIFNKYEFLVPATILICIFVFLIFREDKAQKEALRHYNYLVKEYVVKNILNQEFKDIEYELHEKELVEDIKGLKIFGSNNTIQSQNYMKATYINQGFEFSDVLIRNEYVDKNTKPVEQINYFLGQWILINRKNKVKAYHQIRPNIKNLANEIKDSDESLNLRKISIDNKKFKKLFTVYSSNESEVKKLLTQEVQDKMINFRKEVDKPVYFTFIDDKLHIGVDSHKESFVIFDKEVSKEFIENVTDDIKAIQKTIKEFEI